MDRGMFDLNHADWHQARLKFMANRLLFCAGIAVFSCAASFAADTFSIATYNVENYLDQPTESRPHPKTAEAKAKVRESIRALNPDVLALEEMGGTNALLELRSSLQAEGADYPFWELVGGTDTNIHVAVLSRLPMAARRPHTSEDYLLDGRRFHVSRGFAEVDIRAATNYTFTLIVAHLKSRRPTPEADEAEQRLEEAKILRGIVDEHFKADPNSRLVVLGDFNDGPDSDAVKAIIGRGKFKLTDTRPVEREGGTVSGQPPDSGPRTVAWTYYYRADDTFSRMDYILLSPAMARGWLPDKTRVLALQDWGVASDHRPLFALFQTP